jgi:hypothetical protein
MQQNDPFAGLVSGGFGGSNKPISTASSSSAQPQRAKVMYDYTAQAANQITVKAGWIIDIVNLGAPGGWTKGKDLSGIRTQTHLGIPSDTK